MQPLFLELGKALFTCQAFEETLVFMLSLLAHDARTGEAGAFSSAFDLYSQKTLGHLLKALETKIELPDEVRESLATGWERRNAIVHRFIHDNQLLLAQPKGRLQVEAALASYKAQVRMADKIANVLLDQLLKKYGTSVSELKRNADSL